MNNRDTTETNGKLISELRKQLNWTQAELAKRSGYTERLIVKAESGKSIAMATLQDIRDVFQQSGQPVSLDTLQTNPVSKAREFILGMYVHQADVIDHCIDFINRDVVFDINGDPNIFPFAGHHVGIEAARKAFQAFYSVLQPPEDNTEIESFQFVSTGQGALVWGDTWTHPIGQPMTKPIKLAIRMDFRDGLLVHFDDRFDTHEAFNQFRLAANGASCDEGSDSD